MIVLQDALPKVEEIENVIADPSKLATAVQQDQTTEKPAEEKSPDRPKAATNSLDDGDPPAKSAVESVKEAMAMAKSSGSSKPTAFDIGAASKGLTTIEAQFIAKTLETLIFFI